MYVGEGVVCQKLGGVCLGVSNQGNPVVGGDVVGEDDVIVAIGLFVWAEGLFELPNVGGGVAVLLGELMGEGRGDVVPSVAVWGVAM